MKRNQSIKFQQEMNSFELPILFNPLQKEFSSFVPFNMAPHVSNNHCISQPDTTRLSATSLPMEEEVKEELEVEVETMGKTCRRVPFYLVFFFCFSFLRFSLRILKNSFLFYKAALFADLSLQSTPLFDIVPFCCDYSCRFPSKAAVTS
jgi:hypothetical protein